MVVGKHTRTTSEFAPRILPGDLLPNVDPTDQATWACLLQDLAQALFTAEPKETWLPGLTWTRHRSGWLLGLGLNERVMVFSEDDRDNTGMGSTPLFFCEGSNTDNPAEALILARIQLREEG